MIDAWTDASTIDGALAERLKLLRTAAGLSLDELAHLCGISRATLSRFENGETSPTASQLGRLCAAHGLPMSRLIAMVEDTFPALMPKALQPVWSDRENGFTRRQVSPPARDLSGEAIEGRIEAGCSIAYNQPARRGLEHHLVLLEGKLDVTVGERTHLLTAGDCLRYQLHGASAFATPADSGARYLLFMV